jgi:hypothetical protein
MEEWLGCHTCLCMWSQAKSKNPTTDLVQLGLFSAIITAFLVDSLSELQLDEAARTNELLMNLPQVVCMASIGIPFNTVTLPQPIPFSPDPSDVRESAFWSISLVLSVS